MAGLRSQSSLNLRSYPSPLRWPSTYELGETALPHRHPSSQDALVRRYFPVTLGKSHELRSELDPLRSYRGPLPETKTTCPAPEGLPGRREEPWRPKTPHNKTELNRFWQSTRDLYLNDVAPSIAAADVFIRSPYQDDLAEMRIKRLMLEEEIMSEVRRQEELEKSRGPTPKWYELKTPQFHYEARKNNKVMKSTDKWPEIIETRASMEEASDQFRKMYRL